MERYSAVAGRAKHLYEIQVMYWPAGTPEPVKKTVEVDANNRDQAARYLKKVYGWSIQSVNMVA